jgi:lysophospholipase L1-like esterase
MSSKISALPTATPTGAEPIPSVVSGVTTSFTAQQIGSLFKGGTMTSALNEAPTVTIASSSAPAIGAAAGNTIQLTGTTTVTGFDTVAAGITRRVRFSGILTLTYNATSLILPTSASITTAADDVAEFLSLGSGNWMCTSYQRKSGAALTGSSFTGGTLTSALNNAPPVTIASSTTPAIFAAAGNTINMTGTTTVTGFDTIAAGARRTVIFAAALILTHNATSMINITGANITTAAGDVAVFESLGSGNTKMLSYTRKDGSGVSNAAFNTATTFDAFGDSITLGTGASTSALNYVNLIASRRGWTVTNHGAGGDMVPDQADDVIALTVGNGSQSTLMLGTNDAPTYGTDASKQAAFRLGHLHHAAYLAIPNSRKTFGQAGSTSGTWTNDTTYGSGVMKASEVVASTHTTTIYGTVAYVAMLQQHTNTSTYSISIDGVSQGTFNSDPGVTITTAHGIAYSPALRRFPGLTEGAHTVVVTVVSAAVGHKVFVIWTGGNLGSKTKTGPNVWVGNIPRLSAAEYVTLSSTAAVTATFNGIIRSNVQTLANDGLNVALVDSGSRMDPTTNLDADGIHPNDSGHDIIAEAFLEGINQIGKPRTSIAFPVSIDGTFAANSDDLIPSQKAVKTYVTAAAGGTATRFATGADDNSGDRSITSTSYVDATNYTASITAASGDRVVFRANFTPTIVTANQSLEMQLKLNGVALTRIIYTESDKNKVVTAEWAQTLTGSHVSGGVCVAQMQWKVSGGTVKILNSSNWGGLVTMFNYGA